MEPQLSYVYLCKQSLVFVLELLINSVSLPSAFNANCKCVLLCLLMCVHLFGFLSELYLCIVLEEREDLFSPLT